MNLVRLYDTSETLVNLAFEKFIFTGIFYNCFLLALVGFEQEYSQADER